MLLHVASSPAGAAVTVSIIFLLIFAMSFAFGPVPEGGRRFSAEWTRGWLIASAPRMIVAGVFAGLVLVAALSYGNSSTQAAVSCERGVPPLTGQAVTSDRIATAIASLNDIAGAASAGDSQRAREVWNRSDAHNLTHDIDGQLRRVSEDSARALCQDVVSLEDAMVGDTLLADMDEKARAVASRLQEARPLLSSDSTQTPTALDPCSSPIGAMTDQPLSAERIGAAASQLRQVAALASSGDRAGAEALFAGDAHNITHDIDGPLRVNNEQTAIELCRAVSEIESHLGPGYDSSVVSTNSETAAGLLEAAARVLGIIQ